ncbi:MAG: class-II fumarase/aspartase family protein [Bryobacteraceae bacterium]
MRLIDSFSTTEALAEVFSDASVAGAMLAVEVALARAEAQVGAIPADAVAAVEKAAREAARNTAELARATQRAGTPGIPIARALASSGYAHWGATSQDIADTALVLLLDRARALVAADQARLDAALAWLSERHKSTVLLGRTLGQPAPPVTFGLKAAGWLASLRRGWNRIARAWESARIVQFGGASGTLASLGDQGMAVGSALARELGLGWPDAPWHAHRDRFAEFVAACGVYTGSLGKMARDVALLMQAEVGEASEPGGEGRGGSSTMPHKQNPIACSLAMAAAHRTPALVAAYLSAMGAEHERGAGAWQSEWATMAAVIQATGLAAASMAEAAEGLTVDESKMRANIEATLGVVFAERAMMMLAGAVGLEAARGLVETAVRRSQAERRRFRDVLAGMPEVTGHLSPEALRELDSPEGYLGSAEPFRVRLLESKE